MSTTAFDAKREQVVSAIAVLFAHGSYRSTGVAEISEAVGLGKGALYRYIGSKEAVLFDICMSQVSRMNASAQRIVALEASATTRLRLLARGLVENIANHRAEWIVFFRDYDALSGDRLRAVLAERDAYEAQWQLVFEQGRDANLFTTSSPLLIKGALGMFNYTYLWFRPDGDVTAAELADTFIDVLLEGLSPRQVPNGLPPAPIDL